MRDDQDSATSSDSIYNKGCEIIHNVCVLSGFLFLKLKCTVLGAEKGKEKERGGVTKKQERQTEEQMGDPEE